MKNDDVQYLKKVLPAHYTCKKTDGGVVCSSNTGIVDESKWNKIFDKIKQYFDARFLEVYHQTCTSHVKFTVYLKKK